MNIEKTHIEGCFVIEPEIRNDKRGYFFESFNLKVFKELTGITPNFVQDNQSLSSYGVMRGLHYQEGDYAQSKLVRVIKGSVQDVVVDIRPGSITFGKYFSIVLNDASHKQLYIPRGMAHGFLVLEDDTIFSYKCDNFYNKESERGIIYNDKNLGIDWAIGDDSINLSEKDKNLPTLKDLF